MVLVATSTVAFMIRAFRVSPSLLVGWIIKNVLILLVLIAGYLLRPEIAGYLAGGIWIGLVLIPTLLQRLVVRASIQQKHARARAIARVVAVLHPFDGFREQGELYRGLEAAQRGEVEEAAKIFDRLRASRSVLSRVGAMHYYRVTEQWEEFAVWTQQMAKEGELARNPSLLIHYLRALGELGKIEELVRTYHRLRSMAERNLPPSVRLIVLSFSGRREALERVLGQSLFELPESVKSLWRATADAAAGDAESARVRLEALRADPDATVASQARYRLEHPPPIAEQALSEEAKSLLASLEQDLQQEERYKPAAGGLLKRARVTWALIAASVVVFAVEMIAGGSMDPATLFALGAVEGERVLAGEVWRLLAATFLHYGFLHLSLNMIGLVLFGPFVERTLGWWRFLIVYLFAGVGAMSAVVLVSLVLDQPVLLVGASGGIMGLLGATAFLLLRGWRKERSRPAQAQLRQILFILALQTVFDLSIKEVSFMAHFFGMLLGFVACALMTATQREARQTDN